MRWPCERGWVVPKMKTRKSFCSPRATTLSLSKCSIIHCTASFIEGDDSMTPSSAFAAARANPWSSAHVLSACGLAASHASWQTSHSNPWATCSTAPSHASWQTSHSNPWATCSRAACHASWQTSHSNCWGWSLVAFCHFWPSSTRAPSWLQTPQIHQGRSG